MAVADTVLIGAEDGSGDESDWLRGSEGEEEQESMGARETSKVQRKMYDDGYREGIGNGKESMIQTGFDQGFAQKGAPVGRRLGHVRGTLYALDTLLARRTKAGSGTNEQIGNQKLHTAVRRLKQRVDALQMTDVVERDWDAMEHELQHGGQVGALRRETDAERAEREGILPAIQAEADVLVEKVFELAL